LREALVDISEEIVAPLRAEYSHAPYLIHMLGLAFDDAVPLLWEGTPNNPGLWTYDGKDILGVVLPDMKEIRAYLRMLPVKARAMAIRETGDDTPNERPSVCILAFDQKNLIGLEIVPTDHRTYSFRRLLYDAPPDFVSWARQFVA
jgi:hypothetical protein